MTRVDFYILPDAGDKALGPVMAACKLCDKAVAAGSRVYLRAPAASLAEELDGALWSFRQGAFIAHERHGTAAPEEPQPAVLIGDLEPPESHHGVLINLGEDVPPWFSRFERVLEIVPGNAADRSKSRERFKFYRDRGYELSTHKL